MATHISSSEDSCMSLHGPLHLQPEVGGGSAAVGEADLVQVGYGFLSCVGAQITDFLPRLADLGDGLGAGAAEDDEVEQGVGAETVGTVHGGAGGLAGGEEAWNDLVLAVLVRDDLAPVVGGDAAHVVVDGGEHGDGLAGDVDAGKDHGGLGDAGEPLGQLLLGEVVQLKVNVVLVRSTAPALADLNSHGAGDHVAGGKILSHRCIPMKMSDDIRRFSK